VAREGYVNLLPVQQKNSRDPGDNPEMVLARREFLQAGHYQPLRDALVALLAPLRAEHLLDMGCGEGYYTGAFTTIVPAVIGLDIAKPAIQLAAKRFRGITWLVGSTASPIADASVDIVSNLFSPLQIAEMDRVLKPGGHVLLVTPAQDHLWTIREKLFDEVRAHQPEKFMAGFGSQFDLRNQQAVHCSLNLTQQSLRQLLLMTPYAWKAKPYKRAALEASEYFSTQAAFSCMLFQKKQVAQNTRYENS
jgi:23S rRNA (guanine745-N1)-methyltransferase